MITLNTQLFPLVNLPNYESLTIDISLLFRWVTVVVELVLFTAFIWAVVGWFAKAYEVKRWEYRFVQISAIIFIIAHLSAALFWPQPHHIISLVGIVLLLFSGVLFTWTFSTFDKAPSVAFSGAITSSLKVTGPYRFIRHPFYTSYLTAWLGGTLASGCCWLILSFLIMVYVYYLATEEEESQWLTGDHKAEYSLYKQRTGRFFINVRSIFCSNN